MNKQALLHEIVDSVKRKHPWKISQERYVELFGKLPLRFLEERGAYDRLLEKAKGFELCNLFLSHVKVEIRLNIDELIAWELSLDKWEEARAHNILPGDIKKILNADVVK